MGTVRWLTAFIDRPAATFDIAVRFWREVTGSTLSPVRGDDGEFATLLPADGDAYLRVQRVRSGGGTHLDVHVDDVAATAAEAVAAGASRVPGHADIAVLRSPAGFVHCLVRHHGEAVRPAPRAFEVGGPKFLVDQVCIDIPHDRFDEECGYWSALTGWPVTQSLTHTSFARVAVPAELPLRLLLQRREDDDGPTRAHLDLACEDRQAVAAALETLGARVQGTFSLWTLLADPSGAEFCTTVRDPFTGLVPAS